MPRNENFHPATFGNFDDLMINSSSKVLKFWGDEDDDFTNTSPKDFNEGPHGLRGIEEIGARAGFSLERKKLQFEEARES